MPYACRDARLSDLDVLVRLLADDELGRTRERLEDPLPQAYQFALAEILGSTYTRILVIEADDTVIGSLQLTLIPSLSFVGQRRALFESVHVLPDFQGKGAGTELVRHAIGEARRAGAGQVVLTSSNSRKDAHRFWRRMGFQPTHVGMKLFLGRPTAVVAPEQTSD